MASIATLGLDLALLAYLDGGTGSMMIQAALAGILTMAFFAKSQWAAIKARVQAALSRNAKNGG